MYIYNINTTINYVYKALQFDMSGIYYLDTVSMERMSFADGPRQEMHCNRRHWRKMIPVYWQSWLLGQLS